MKKKLFTICVLLLSAVTLVVASVYTTLAYLSSSTAVSNTFTVGNVMIEMFETKVNPDGTPVDNNGIKDADGNSYHLVPGKSYTKDPSIFISAESDSCYIFIKTRNQISHLEDGNVNPTGDDAPTMREQLLAKGWVKLYEIHPGTANTEVIYCYKGSGEVSGDVIATPVAKSTNGQKVRVDLFDTFTIDSDVDVSKSGGAKVTITAFAIQDDGFKITDTKGSTAFMMRLWNIVSGEFDFESVVIPESDIPTTP